MRRPVVVLACLLVALAATACGRNERTGTTTGADEPTRGADQQGYVGSEGALTRIDPDQRTAGPVVSGVQLGADQKKISSADYAGKVLVLNVWGSWCPPCRQEAAGLQAALPED